MDASAVMISHIGRNERHYFVIGQPDGGFWNGGIGGRIAPSSLAPTYQFGSVDELDSYLLGVTDGILRKRACGDQHHALSALDLVCALQLLNDWASHMMSAVVALAFGNIRHAIRAAQPQIEAAIANGRSGFSPPANLVEHVSAKRFEITRRILELGDDAVNACGLTLCLHFAHELLALILLSRQ